MNKNRSATNQAELTPLRELCARIGGDPLLTQASTGNSSIKLEGVLWIKASGEWMANAIHEDILIPLDLAEVKEHVKHKVDPAERYTRASIETAMHAVLPLRVVRGSTPRLSASRTGECARSELRILPTG